MTEYCMKYLIYEYWCNSMLKYNISTNTCGEYLAKNETRDWLKRTEQKMVVAYFKPLLSYIHHSLILSKFLDLAVFNRMSNGFGRVQ
jgi:hypothetical protein